MGSSAQRLSRDEMDQIDCRFFARSLLSMGQTMSTANVIMQLANPAVGYGVARSNVENGRLDRHPIKRARTTASYLAVAVLGNAEDRRRYRQAVNRQHAQVRSDGDSPVEYNAMDPELQLWVAACLYFGWEDIYQRVHGPLAGAEREEFYQQGKVCGTTLQMPAEMWPPDRDAFARYWDAQVGRVQISDEVREFLLDIANFGYAHPVIQKRFGPVKYRRTIGYLPPEFREAMRVSWTDEDQQWFDEYVARHVMRERKKPLWLSQLGFRVLLWDVRVRCRFGRPLV
ncbi:oxygenase MpaB family protein [Mycolicibacterium sp. 050232]|uniref:oxygenase MpaB family protein n=1 Tax=Mycolicibacterium sp. 050232 TaxID=3113982 RepID=UPI002E2AA924|nr:oxygenase MpaB family protein [Mycolicibacterium sp. 050232]MED5811245.1 oxygenase MpaB family protein [Mycolicibacterium sp. 050232]